MRKRLKVYFISMVVIVLLLIVIHYVGFPVAIVTKPPAPLEAEIHLMDIESNPGPHILEWGGDRTREE